MPEFVLPVLSDVDDPDVVDDADDVDVSPLPLLEGGGPGGGPNGKPCVPWLPLLLSALTRFCRSVVSVEESVPSLEVELVLFVPLPVVEAAVDVVDAESDDVALVVELSWAIRSCSNCANAAWTLLLPDPEDDVDDPVVPLESVPLAELTLPSRLASDESLDPVLLPVDVYADALGGDGGASALASPVVEAVWNCFARLVRNCDDWPLD